MKGLFCFFSLFSLSLSIASENFSSYTLVEVLREEMVSAQEKERWVMKNILGLNDEELEKNEILKKKRKKKDKDKMKREKKDRDKMKRKTRLQEWSDSL